MVGYICLMLYVVLFTISFIALIKQERSTDLVDIIFFFVVSFPLAGLIVACFCLIEKIWKKMKVSSNTLCATSVLTCIVLLIFIYVLGLRSEMSKNLSNNYKSVEQQKVFEKE